MSRNPYQVAERPPNLRPSVLAYMDVVGYASFSQPAYKQGAQQEALAKINSALKAITENIVVGWPAHDDAESQLGDAFWRLGGFQLQMVLSGFFVRGAITVGDAYVDDIAVFGNALGQSSWRQRRV